ncbi:MAG TPA: vWA domain-containing protein [Longimicrobiales bacterium]
MRRFTLAVALLAACGSGPGEDPAATPAAGAADTGAAPTAAATPRQVIVLLDLSASQTPAMLAESRRFLDGLVERLGFGDRIVLLEVHRAGVREAARRWADTFPRLPDPGHISMRDRTRLEGARDAARSVARAFFDSASAGKALHTDLFATLHIAAEYARDGGGRRTVLVLLSDMLQSDGNIEMERLRRMPPADWITRQRAAGVLPNLRGACVVVVGADATTRAGTAVRDFWVEYFEAAGARLRRENYRLLAPGAAVGCD